MQYAISREKTGCPCRIFILGTTARATARTATETLLTQGSSSAEATPPWPNAEALHWDICSARRQTPSRWPPAAARPAARRARAGTLRMLRRTCPATNTGRTSYANPTRRPEPLPPVSDMHALPTYPWRTGHLTAALPHMFVSRWVALALWISATGLVALRAWVRTTASTCGTDGPPAVTTGSE
jgi:hypothetical protein